MAEAIAFCATAYLDTHPPKPFKMDRTKRVFERMVEKSKAKWKVISGKARKEKKARALREERNIETSGLTEKVDAVEQELVVTKMALEEEKERGWADRYRQCQLRIQAEEEREARIADSSIILNLIEEQETTAAQRASLEAKLKVAKEEVATKSAEVKQLEARVIKAEQDLTSANEARNFHKGETSRLAIELRDTKKERDNVRIGLVNAQKESEATKKKFDNFKTANDNHVKDIKKLKIELEDTKEKLVKQTPSEPQQPNVTVHTAPGSNAQSSECHAKDLTAKIAKMEQDHKVMVEHLTKEKMMLINQKANLEADLGEQRAKFRAWKQENAARDPESPNSLTNKGNEYLEKLYDHLQGEHERETQGLREELRRAERTRDLLFAMLDAAREEKEPEPRKRSPSGGEDSSKGTDDGDDNDDNDDGSNGGDSKSSGPEESPEPKNGGADSNDDVDKPEHTEYPEDTHSGDSENTSNTQATSTYNLGRQLEAIASQQQVDAQGPTTQLNATAPEFHPQPRMTDEELWRLQNILSSVAAPQTPANIPEETDTSFFDNGISYSRSPQPAQPAVSPSTNSAEDGTALPQDSGPAVYQFSRPPYSPEDFRKLEHLEYEVLSREIRERNLRSANGMDINVSSDYAAEQFHHQHGTSDQMLYKSYGPRSPPKYHRQMNIVGVPSRLRHELDVRDLDEEDAVAEHIHQTHGQVIMEKEDRWMPPSDNNWADEDEDGEGFVDLVADAVHRFAASESVANENTASNGSKSPTPELSEGDEEEESESDSDDDEINIDLGEAAETGYVPDKVAQAMNFRKWD